MTHEATSYIQGIIWDPPVDEHLSSLIGAVIRVRKAAGSVGAVNHMSSSDETRSSLEEVDDNDWDWDGWLHRGLMSPGCPVIGLRDQSSGRVVGFCSIETNALVMSAPFAGMIDLNLEIASVYVRPDHRGQGFGSILRQAATTYVRSIIDAIAAIPPDDVADLGLSGLSVTVSAHPESQAGHAFANGVSGAVEVHLANMADTAWFGRASLIDDTDPEEAPSLV